MNDDRPDDTNADDTDVEWCPHWEFDHDASRCRVCAQELAEQAAIEDRTEGYRF